MIPSEDLLEHDIIHIHLYCLATGETPDLAGCSPAPPTPLWPFPTLGFLLGGFRPLVCGGGKESRSFTSQCWSVVSGDQAHSDLHTKVIWSALQRPVHGEVTLTQPELGPSELVYIPEPQKEPTFGPGVTCRLGEAAPR